MAKVRDQNLVIQKLAKAEGEDLSQPVVAYVTFASQEGYERCEKFLFKTDRKG